MKVTFTTTPKSFEKANYVLAQAIDNIKGNTKLLQHLELKQPDIKVLETFRAQMVKGFTKSAEQEEEMQGCECGHRVPIEFAVGNDDGQYTCMPCHIAITSEPDSREHFLIDPKYKLVPNLRDKDNHSLIQTEEEKNKYWKAYDADETWCVFPDAVAALEFVIQEFENNEKDSVADSVANVYPIYLSDEEVATMPEYNP